MSGSLKSLFGALTPGLTALANRAAAQQNLTEVVRGRLPEALRPHLIAAARRGEDLVVIMDSAAWTARIRYAARSLKAGLEADGVPAIDKLHVKVRGGATLVADDCG